MRRPLVVALLTMACGGRSTATAWPSLDGTVPMRTTPDADFRSTPPLSTSVPTDRTPEIVERRLFNGVRVLFIERHEVPMIALRLVSDRGSDQADPGIAYLWTRAAMRAGVDHPYWEVAEAFNNWGVSWSAHASNDSSQLELRVLSRLAHPAIEVFADLVAKPAFLPTQLTLVRQRVEATLKVQYATADTQLLLAIRDFYYPKKHPYHEPLAPPDNVDKITAAHLEAYQAYAFTPEHTTVAVAGDTTIDELMPMLQSTFGKLSGPKIGAQPPPPAPPEPSLDQRLIVVNRPGNHALIGATWLGPTRDEPDRNALTLALHELDARLFTRLREQMGITYGVHTKLENKRGQLPISIETEVEVDRVGDAISEILTALEQASKEPVPEADLALDRAAIIDHAKYFESIDSAASLLGHIATYNLLFDYYRIRGEKILATSAEDVRKAFARWLSRDKVVFIIVGEGSVVRPQLTKLGLGDVRWQSARSL